jgi:hypothetical protein
MKHKRITKENLVSFLRKNLEVQTSIGSHGRAWVNGINRESYAVIADVVLEYLANPIEQWEIEMGK